MSVTVSINGTDLASHSIYANLSPEEWLSAPASSRPIARTPGRGRGYRASIDEVASRTFAIPFRLNTSTVANRLTESDWLKAFHRQDITLKYDDGSFARELLCTVTGVRIVPVAHMSNPVCDGTLTVVAADPVWRATSDTTETINGTPNSADLGTAPVEDWVLTITAGGGSSIVDITVTFGAYTLVWIGTIASTKSLVISASAFTVKNDGVTAIGTYTGGFPVLDPAAAPSVSAVKASGAGTLSGSLVYKKRHW